MDRILEYSYVILSVAFEVYRFITFLCWIMYDGYYFLIFLCYPPYNRIWSDIIWYNMKSTLLFPLLFLCSSPEGIWIILHHNFALHDMLGHMTDRSSLEENFGEDRVSKILRRECISSSYIYVVKMHFFCNDYYIFVIFLSLFGWS